MHRFGLHVALDGANADLATRCRGDQVTLEPLGLDRVVDRTDVERGSEWNEQDQVDAVPASIRAGGRYSWGSSGGGSGGGADGQLDVSGHAVDADLELRQVGLDALAGREHLEPVLVAAEARVDVTVGVDHPDAGTAFEGFESLRGGLGPARRVSRGRLVRGRGVGEDGNARRRTQQHPKARRDESSLLQPPLERRNCTAELDECQPEILVFRGFRRARAACGQGSHGNLAETRPGAGARPIALRGGIGRRTRAGTAVDREAS